MVYKIHYELWNTPIAVARETNNYTQVVARMGPEQHKAGNPNGRLHHIV